MKTERLKIKMPAGVEDGQVIRLRNKGGDGKKGGRTGDLLITVQIKKHSLLERKGYDLLLDLPITVKEAVLGGKVEVPTVTGPVRVTIPAGSADGQKMRLKGRGLPNKSGVGALYLVLRIAPPSSDSPELVKLVEQLDEFYPDDPRAKLAELLGA